MSSEMYYLHKVYWKLFQPLELGLYIYCLSTSQYTNSAQLYIRQLYKLP